MGASSPIRSRNKSRARAHGVLLREKLQKKGPHGGPNGERISVCLQAAKRSGSGMEAKAPAMASLRCCGE